MELTLVGDPLYHAAWQTNAAAISNAAAPIVSSVLTYQSIGNCQQLNLGTNYSS
jgi:hypothetical protein